MILYTILATVQPFIWILIPTKVISLSNSGDIRSILFYILAGGIVSIISVILLSFLSGGQRQKLYLARAIYKRNRFLMLDEPTAALDPLAEAELYEKYNALSKGKTSIYISHRLASTKFCDRVAYIKDGKILEIGSHEELMELGGEYNKIFNIQSKYYKNIDEMEVI